ncbi:unnamed protein product [Camellia sinensis]
MLLSLPSLTVAGHRQSPPSHVATVIAVAVAIAIAEITTNTVANHSLVIIGWILITGTFILCVIFLLLHKTADHFHGNGRAAQTWRPFRLLRSLEDH